MANDKQRELTGRDVLIICLLSFGVIIGVNVIMAVQAVRTFPGVEVQNSYVASQSFESDRKAQQALGWGLKTSYSDGRLQLVFSDGTGTKVMPEGLTVLLGRTTEAADDQTLTLRPEDGKLVADIALEPGKWMLRVEGKSANGTSFRQRIDLFVGG
jgi:nitrogen fixation protein FixH